MARAVTRKAKLTAGSAVPEKQTDAKPARRASSPGRPARLSREMILEKSMELLVEHSVEGFTLARLRSCLLARGHAGHAARLAVGREEARGEEPGHLQGDGRRRPHLRRLAQHHSHGGQDATRAGPA